MVEIQGLEHGYGGRRVLTVPQLRLEAGVVTAVVGPNGCGKTTLLRLLAFLEPPTRGTITLDGTTPSTARMRRWARRRVTLIDQEPLMLPGTVRDNLEWGLRAHGTSRDEIRTRTAAALDAFDLVAWADRPARQLSAGERQQVALVRALVLRPRGLLLDEPTGAADRTATERVASAIAEARGEGAAIVITSHRPAEAYRWSDRLLSLAGGQIDTLSPENMFRVTLPPGDGAKTVALGALAIQVVTDRVGPATLTLPPEDLLVSTTPVRSSARNHFAGRVTAIAEDRPGRVSLTVDAGLDLVACLTPSSLADLGLQVGAEVVLTIKASAVRVV